MMETVPTHPVSLRDDIRNSQGIALGIHKTAVSFYHFINSPINVSMCLLFVFQVSHSFFLAFESPVLLDITNNN